MLRNNSFRFFAALAALLVFTADVVDDICDGTGCAVVGQSSQSAKQDKAPCSHSHAPNHDETAVASTSAITLPLPLVTDLDFPTTEQAAPVGLPASIDHPPQLA